VVPAGAQPTTPSDVTPDDSGSGAPAKTVSLDDLVRTRLTNRYDLYVARGAEQFRTGRYSEAFNSFVLADTARAHSLEAKKGIILSAIATSRYAIAANAAASVARYNSDFATHPFDIRAAYGSTDDYTAHYRVFDDYVRRDTTKPTAVLAAIAAWGRGDRVMAETYATRAAEDEPPNSPFVRFASSIRQPQAAVSNPVGPGASVNR
jgi:hypothetical protein